jgi:hypothetical protein
VVVRDPQTKQPVGGLTGRTSLGLLFIDLFFHPDDLRGGGLRSRLLRLAEDQGSAAWLCQRGLYTINFGTGKRCMRRGKRN